jgi:hypothetical protein
MPNKDVITYELTPTSNSSSLCIIFLTIILMNVVDLNDYSASDASVSNPPAPDTGYTPDEQTKERFKYLAVVGKMLMQTANENRYQTDYYIAKQALDKFIELYRLLDLDPESKEGMEQLIDYLRKKIDRRLNASIQTSGTDV